MTTSRRVPPAPGFEHIGRMFDAKLEKVIARVQPGELYVTTDDELIQTTLGSCIAVCIRDEKAHIGGMNHFMLPLDKGAGRGLSGDAARYGGGAMELLFNELLKRGGNKGRFEVKVFGGGNVLNGVSDVGETNIEFIHQFLRDEGLIISSEDVGGHQPRKILFHPLTGKVRMKKMGSADQKLRDEEAAYKKTLTAQPVGGEIELF